jgi:glycosyltransferase involved in cell wall biosynthesis
MAGPLTWELAEDMGAALGSVALLTGHPDTLAKGDQPQLRLFRAAPYKRGSYPVRILAWLHYMLQAFFWLWRWPRSTPLLLFSNPPCLPWLGLAMRVLRGQHYSVMVHDIYPDVLTRLVGVPEQHPVVHLWRWLNRLAYERAEVVMTLGEHMAATLAQQFNPARTPAGAIKVIYPWADTEAIRPIPKAENPFAQQHGQVDKLTVMYSGNMGLGHDIETMLAAAVQLQSEPGIHFMFIGAGPKWQLVADTISEHQLANVTLLPWQPEEMLPYSLAACDIAMVSLDEGAEGLAFPSKSIYAMAAGSALLGLSRTPSDLQLIIQKNQCGNNILPGDTNGFADTIVHWYKNLETLNLFRHRARASAEKLLSRKYGVQQITKLVNRNF